MGPCNKQTNKYNMEFSGENHARGIRPCKMPFKDTCLADAHLSSHGSPTKNGSLHVPTCAHMHLAQSRTKTPEKSIPVCTTPGHTQITPKKLGTTAMSPVSSVPCLQSETSYILRSLERKQCRCSPIFAQHYQSIYAPTTPCIRSW
jgi:hypothetical protein